MFPFVREMDLGVMAYSPLAVGLLSGDYSAGEPAPSGTLWGTRRSEEFQSAISGGSADVIRTVAEIAGEIGKTPAQVALAWVLSHPEISVAMTGGDTIEHLEDNVGAVGWTLDEDARERLDGVSASMSMVLD